VVFEKAVLGGVEPLGPLPVLDQHGSGGRPVIIHRPKADVQPFCSQACLTASPIGPERRGFLKFQACAC